MERDEAIVDFLKGLRVVINNASAYSKEHPYFRKSVENFKPKIDALLSFLNPIKIGFTLNSLFIDEKYWEKAMLYIDIASIFHLRKIKSIELQEGATIEELIDFLSAVSYPIKEILRQGGIQNILKLGKSSHILIEELDYSELLQSESGEYKDIWVYLFKATVQSEDSNKINDFADKFEKIIGNFRMKDIYEDEEFRQNLHSFLYYLKIKDKAKFSRCSKQLLKLILTERGAPSQQELDKLNILLQEFDNDDLSDVLLESISIDEGFDNFSFAIFFQLFKEKRHEEIALSLGGKLKEAESIKNNLRARKKIKELFSTRDNLTVLPFYRHAFSWISDKNLSEGNLFFDHIQAKNNYRFTLLNLFVREKEPESLELIASNLAKERDKIIEENDLGLLKFFWEAVDKKNQEHTPASFNLEELTKPMASFVENQIFVKEDLSGLGYFLDKIKESYLGLDSYQKKIFDEGRVNPSILKLLFRLFPDKLPEFYQNLQKKHSDIDFLARVIKSLELADCPASLETLKNIFSFSNSLIKIEALKAMQRISNYDPEFLFSILNQEGAFLKKEALLVLARDEINKKTALGMLLSIPSPFGRKNKIILENINAVEQSQLKEAAGYLIPISRRPFFWNRNIRDKARQVLRDWHVGKN